MQVNPFYFCFLLTSISRVWFDSRQKVACGMITKYPFLTSALWKRMSVVTHRPLCTREIKSCYQLNKRYAGTQLVEALRYKPEGLGFDSRRFHWNFSFT